MCELGIQNSTRNICDLHINIMDDGIINQL
jgi:hypothetical protein